MTAKEVRRKLKLTWTIFLIEIPALGILAFLMNNIEGFRLIPFEMDGPVIRISVWIAFSIISIPLGYLFAHKKMKAVQKEEGFLSKATLYMGAYNMRIAVVNGNALFCIITYYGLDMPLILTGLPVYLLILLFDKPASETKLEHL